MNLHVESMRLNKGTSCWTMLKNSLRGGGGGGGLYEYQSTLGNLLESVVRFQRSCLYKRGTCVHLE